VEVTGGCRNSIMLLLTKYYSGDQIKEGQMGQACGTRGVEEKLLKRFGRKT
jgi:hypothetical protein